MAKVILITGASAGIGRACAQRLHEKDWTVVGASRRGTSSGGWTPMVMDVDDDGSVGRGVACSLAAATAMSESRSENTSALVR